MRRWLPIAFCTMHSRNAGAYRSILCRAETDGSHSASELARGRAIENVMVCAKNAMSAARNLGKHVAVGIPHGNTYLELSKQMPQDKSVQFPEFREEMIDGWRLKKGTFFAPGGAPTARGVYAA